MEICTFFCFSNACSTFLLYLCNMIDKITQVETKKTILNGNKTLF